MILLKKIFRDLRTNRAANIAATVLISIALMIFTFMSNVNESLNLSKATFYKDSSFADIFSDVRAFPREKISALASVEGIRTVEGRVVEDFIVKDPETRKLAESRYLRLFAGSDSLCRFIIEEGRRPQRNGEIAIDPMFARANGYSV